MQKNKLIYNTDDIFLSHAFNIRNTRYITNLKSRTWIQHFHIAISYLAAQ